MRSICRSLFVFGLLFSACGWAKSQVHMIVPSVDATELPGLARNAGARAEVITTTGTILYVQVTGGAPDTLHVLRALGDEGDVDLPFDSLALVYYTEPSRNPKKPQTVPSIDQFPNLPPVGKAERTMDCAQLDTQLAHASAIRWYPRSLGYGLPVLRQHAKAGEVAAMVGIGVLVMAACLAGGCANPELYTGAHLDHTPAFDSAVYAADERIDGLLRLKESMHCEGRPTLDPGKSDLQLWTAAVGDPTRDQLTRRLAESAAFDLMGPSLATSSTDASYEVSWLPNVDHTLKRRERNAADSWKGSLALADHEVVITLHEHDRAGQKSSEEIEVDVPYTAITSVEWGAGVFAEPPLVLRWSDGQFGGLQADSHATLRSLQDALFLKMGRVALEDGVLTASR